MVPSRVGARERGGWCDGGSVDRPHHARCDLRDRIARARWVAQIIVSRAIESSRILYMDHWTARANGDSFFVFWAEYFI